MSIASKDDLLRASDLVVREVELPSIGMSVRVRSLAAAYSNEAMSEALEVATDQRGRQVASVNSRKLEELQVLHGLVEPKFSTIEEVQTFSQNVGRAWQKIVETIGEISGVDQATIERTNATFQSGGSGEGGAHLGNGVANRDRVSEPVVPVRTRVEAGDAGG
jgi:hypothetical protein